MYATANLYNRYKQDYVTTASPLDLVIMLYEGCVKQLKLAKIHWEDENKTEASACIQKAEEILLELVRSLNLSIEMSNNLLELYQFMIDELVHADMNGEIERLDPIIEMMGSLKEAWQEIKPRIESGFSESEEG